VNRGARRAHRIGPKLLERATLVDDTWIAIDFETATPERHSACSLGIAVIEDGAVASSGAWLIQPPENRYDVHNIRVHGITPRATAGAPTFGELYPEILPYLQGRHVIAHWASFDISVLRSALAFYRLPAPELHYVCSCRMAQRAYPALRNHRLPTVCQHCGIPLDHHDAGSDAHAAAMVALRCRDEVGAATVHEAVRHLGITVGVL
jgi:DNA polymerase-3 subunit epsilon